MSKEEIPASHGFHKRMLNLESGTVLRYAIYIPKKFSADKPAPLIIALHFGGHVTPYYGLHFMQLLVQPALRGLNALIIAPDCPVNGWANSASESAVIELIEHIKEKYNIDREKVLLTGFSMGGMGTWYIAARHPDLFSAAIPISSSTDEDTLNRIKGIPFYVIHSTGDKVLPFKDVKGLVKKLKKRGYPVRLKVLWDVNHYNTAAFEDSLREAIPWIKKVWKKGKN